MDDRTVRTRVGEVEEALEALEGLPAAPRDTALDAVGALVELYGEGWTRALKRLTKVCPDGPASLAEDELVAHLLMIHGLHPLGVEKRVSNAVRDVATHVNADGVDIEILDVADGVARLRLSGGGHTPATGLLELVQNAVRTAAPELERVEVETPPGPRGRNGGPALVQLQLSRPGKGAAPGVAGVSAAAGGET